MKNPAIDLAPTPQNVQDRKRTELLLEIEEEEAGIPNRLRALVQAQNNLDELSRVAQRIHQEYGAGRLSDKLLKRCGTWVSRRTEELGPPPKQTH